MGMEQYGSGSCKALGIEVYREVDARVGFPNASFAFVLGMV